MIVIRGLVARPLSIPVTCLSPEFIGCFENDPPRNEFEGDRGRS